MIKLYLFKIHIEYIILYFIFYIFHFIFIIRIFNQ